MLQQLAMWAGVLLGVATVASLIFAVWSYRRNGAAQLQLLALSTLQHYLDLAVRHPELASREEDEPVDPRYGWFAAHALHTAATLRTLVGHQPEWERAIHAIVRQHRAYLRSGEFVCEDFAPEFVRYLRQQEPDLRCADLREEREGAPAQAGWRHLEGEGTSAHAHEGGTS